MCRTPPMNTNVINDFLTSGMWNNNEKVIFAKLIHLSSDWDDESYFKVITVDDCGNVRNYTKDIAPVSGEWYQQLML